MARYSVTEYSVRPSERKKDSNRKEGTRKECARAALARHCQEVILKIVVVLREREYYTSNQGERER